MLLLLTAFAAFAAPAMAQRPEAGAPAVDHSAWQALLDDCLDSDHPSGINRFDYARAAARRAELGAYIRDLARRDPGRLARPARMAYWINLYNAVTVKLIVDAWPVDSIRDVGGGWFRRGPWDDEVVTVNGEALSLNDIEHGILRPEFGDPRIHYAVNCASLGCPDLSAEAYVGSRLDEQLDAAATAFLNHPRAVRIDDETLWLSSIFKWYREDFGSDESAVLRHIRNYSNPPQAEALAEFRGRIRYDYDWAINAP